MERETKGSEELADGDPSSNAAKTLRVLSYNAYIAPGIAGDIELRRDALPQKVAELGPDVILFQEVWRNQDAELVADALAEMGYPHRHWVARSGTPPLGSSGLLTVSAHPITAVAFVPFNAGAFPPFAFHADWMAHKGILVTRLETPAGLVDVVNTHFHSGYILHDYLAVRLAQSIESLAAIDSVMGTDMPASGRPPVIYGGDFNSVPHSMPLLYLIQQGRFIPTSEQTEIDHVLVRAGDTLSPGALSAEKVLTEPVTVAGRTLELSDHPAVLATIELVKAPKPPTETGHAAIIADAASYLQDQQDFASKLQAGFALAAAISLLGVLWARTRAQMFHTRRWRYRFAYLLFVISTVWTAYLAFAYLPNHKRDLEEATATLGP